MSGKKIHAGKSFSLRFVSSEVNAKIFCLWEWGETLQELQFLTKELHDTTKWREQPAPLAFILDEQEWTLQSMSITGS